MSINIDQPKESAANPQLPRPLLRTRDVAWILYGEQSRQAVARVNRLVRLGQIRSFKVGKLNRFDEAQLREDLCSGRAGAGEANG